MRKRMISLIIVFFVMMFPIKGFCISQFIENNQSYFNDGEYISMDVAAFTKDGRFFVPIRYLADAIGLSNNEVKWQPESQTVTLSHGDTTINLMVGSKIIFVNGQPIQNDVAPMMLQGRVFLPARIITEAFGCSINYSNGKLTIENSMPQRKELTTKEIVEKIQPSVVQIKTQRGLGSGFFVTADGIIVTNAHVVRGSSEIVITTYNNKTYNGQLYAIDNAHDLAMLKIEGYETFPFLEHYAKLSSVAVGDEVIVFGNPFGLNSTVTRGIVSAIRNLQISEAWQNNNKIIQYDATTAPGSSGGPVINEYGEFIGIHFAGYNTKDFNFAIPADFFETFNLIKHKYNLNDDFWSYFTESWEWHNQHAEIMEQLSNFSGNLTQATISLISNTIPSLETLLSTVKNYHAQYNEIERLRHDFIDALEKEINSCKLIIQTIQNPYLYSTADKTVKDASNAYNDYLEMFDYYLNEFARQ